MNPLTNVRNQNKINQRELEMGYTGTKNSWHNKYKDSAWIFIGGLPYDLTEGDILCIFSQYGEIVNINLVRDKSTGKSKGFCFLCYEDQRSTILSVDNLNGTKVLNRTLRVDHVESYRKPKETGEEDEITRLLREHGCAPQVPPVPVAQVESEEEVLPMLVQKPAKKKKVKKEKKKKKKKKKAKSDSSSSESESESEDEAPKHKVSAIKQERSPRPSASHSRADEASRRPRSQDSAREKYSRAHSSESPSPPRGRKQKTKQRESKSPSPVRRRRDASSSSSSRSPPRKKDTKYHSYGSQDKGRSRYERRSRSHSKERYRNGKARSRSRSRSHDRYKSYNDKRRSRSISRDRKRRDRYDR